MKTLAVIAEYNPFHNGHKYHLEQSLKVTGADYAITIMSGNFLQRGTTAIADKFTRTSLALRGGVDLVLELPFPYATGSAMDFSMGAISILNKLQSVDYLCFGAENPDLETFYKVSDVILSEPDSYRSSLKNHLASGNSYPLARSKALEEYFKDFSLGEFVSSPNNILGIEYVTALRRLGSNIIPVPIKRVCAGYHDTNLYGNISSASAIREHFTSSATPTLESIKKDIPEDDYEILSQKYQQLWPIYDSELTPFLQSTLLREMDFTEICDINQDFSNKLKALSKNCSYQEALEQLKSKDLTLTRVSRNLIHLLLDYKKADRDAFVSKGYALYANILGLRKESSSLLKNINTNSSIPVINKKADFYNTISAYNQDTDIAKLMWKLDLKATDLYNCLIYNKYGTFCANDYSTPVVIL